ncbi:hypothetical protein HMPREF9144_0090 [Prevotella pallens ATCC 700821]|uniref:Uncharacterized protein n=1 Tax=Prevotella pallens ATCC 700821 TaxID=997353 RepID=F9DEK0_9BACT|nr:hypothetical protein HMPREF9144_0090 [Prevotella pallens ATCC 700821]
MGVSCKHLSFLFYIRPIYICHNTFYLIKTNYTFTFSPENKYNQ